MAISKFMMVKLMLLMKRIMAKFTVGEALQSLLTRKEPTSGKVQERDPACCCSFTTVASMSGMVGHFQGSTFVRPAEHKAFAYKLPPSTEP